MKLYKIYDKVYRVEIRLMTGSLDELKQYAAKHGKNPAELKESLGYTIKLNDGILLWLPEFDLTKPVHYATLSHELVHVADYIFEHRDIRYWHECTETFAYYIEYLTKEFLEKLFKGKFHPAII